MYIPVVVGIWGLGLAKGLYTQFKHISLCILSFYIYHHFTYVCTLDGVQVFYDEYSEGLRFFFLLSGSLVKLHVGTSK